GFCYFSNIAIAALDVLENAAQRVAIWDFDAHHGNGTEAIVAHNSRIAFASIHQFPAYPGTGTKTFANVNNYPLASFTPRCDHVDHRFQLRGCICDFEILTLGSPTLRSKQPTAMNIFEIAVRKSVSSFCVLGVTIVDPEMPFCIFTESMQADELILCPCRRLM